MVSKNPDIRPAGPTPIADQFEFQVDSAVKRIASAFEVSPQLLTDSIRAVNNAAYDAIVRLEEQLREVKAGRQF